jgi:ketosteroid isomerase-like protein
MHPNEQLIRQALDAFLAGNVEAFAQTLSDDFVIHIPGTHPLAGDYKGRESFLGEFIGRVMELTGGTLQIEVHDVLASDDHAAGIYVFRAQRDGQSAEWHHVNVYHVRDGKIAEVWWNPVEQDVVDRLLA